MDIINSIGINGTEAVLLVVFVIGWVELVKALFTKKWLTAATIAVAGASGGVAGLLLGFPILTGIVGGLAGSGLVTIAQKLGKNNVAVTIEEN